MSKIKFTIETTKQTLSQLAKGVRREGSRLWGRAAIVNGPAVSLGIGTMLVKKFESTAVAKSLRGQGSEDLPAHFGLSDGMASALVDGMGELIRSSVQIISKRDGHSVYLRIRAVSTDWNEYLSLPGAQYISSPSNITIPVAKWLLIDPSIDIGQAAYDIVFKGEDSKVDAQIEKVSRSGRAIMVSLEKLGGSGGYVLPSIVSGQAGQNFIEYTLGQKGVAIEAANILMKKVG
jgi:hypothetical protein